MSKALNRHRHNVENIANLTHQGLSEALEMLHRGDAQHGYVIAKRMFPLALWAADRRWHGTQQKRYRTTRTAIDMMRANRFIDADFAVTLQKAATSAEISWNDDGDARCMIETGLKVIEMSDSKSLRKKRELAARKPNKRRTIGRLATAATALFAFVGR